MAFLFFAAVIAGLLLFLSCKGDWKEIGRILLFSSVLAFLITIAPAAVRLIR